LQNSPLESSCVVVALTENYSTSEPLKVSPEKSDIFGLGSVVTNERYRGCSSGCVFYHVSLSEQGYTVAQLVEALRYKPEGCGFDS
jgi:hypothetical protein